MELSPQEEEYLEEIYFNPEHPGSFGGENKLYRVIKEEGRFPITHKKLRKWLSSQETYTLHKPARRKYSRRPIIVSGSSQQADADLVDMIKFSKYNNDTKFILVYIDVFSKKLWTEPLKSKSGKDVTEALRKIYKEGGRCERMRTDKGTEFLNKNVQTFLAENKVHHFVSQNPSIKASVAERSIKNLKKKIYKYMNQFQTYEYLTVLPKLTSAYNRTFHRSIGMSPAQVSKENESQVFATLYKKKARKLSQKKEMLKFKVGDWVRVSYLKDKFSREYYNSFSGEVYQIVSASLKQGRPSYQLQDYSGEILDGFFYPEEIQILHIPDNPTYRIERIVRSRTNKKNKKKEYLVKWLNWGERWNSWVSEEEIRDLPKPPSAPVTNQKD